MNKHEYNRYHQLLNQLWISYSDLYHSNPKEVKEPHEPEKTCVTKSVKLGLVNVIICVVFSATKEYHTSSSAVPVVEATPE